MGLGVYGGEEFLIVIPGCDLATTFRRANQIRELISDKPVITPRGAIDVTISIEPPVTDCRRKRGNCRCAVLMPHCIKQSAMAETEWNRQSPF